MHLYPHKPILVLIGYSKMSYTLKQKVLKPRRTLLILLFDTQDIFMYS